jgi:hypothetical protein
MIDVDLGNTLRCLYTAMHTREFRFGNLSGVPYGYIAEASWITYGQLDTTYMPSWPKLHRVFVLSLVDKAVGYETEGMGFDTQFFTFLLETQGTVYRLSSSRVSLALLDIHLKN